MRPRNATSYSPIVIFVASLLCLNATPLPAQWLGYRIPGVPRTADGKVNLSAPTPKAPDGKPDLSGFWESDTAYFYDLAKDLKPGDLVMQPWAKTLQAEREGKEHQDDPLSDCMPPGVPRINMSTDAMVHPFKIVQTPKLVVLLYETSANSTFRQVFTDGRPFPKDPQPTWLGYSIGRWEADAFVIESRGFNDRSWLDDDGHPHTDALHTIERFRRSDFGHMTMQITIDDPKAYVKPWSATFHHHLLPDTELIEYICDNEKDVPHLVGK